MLELLGDYEVSEYIAQKRRETEQCKERESADRAAVKESDRQSEAGHVVYYVRLGHNHVKIGTTNDLPRRMKELRVVNASNLLAAEPGGYSLERGAPRPVP